MRKIVALLAMLGGSGMASATSNILYNGSFDEPLTNQAPGTWSIHPNLTGWTDGVGVEVRDNVAGTAYDGSNYIELDTHPVASNSYAVDTNSWIAQSFNAIAGYTYSLSFAYSARNIPGLDDKAERKSDKIQAKVFQGNNVLLSSVVTGNNNTSGNIWNIYSYSFTALSSGSTTVKFLAKGTDDTYGGSLDAISLTVSAVPEPETYAMFLAGLGIMAGVARRRKLHY